MSKSILKVCQLSKKGSSSTNQELCQHLDCHWLHGGIESLQRTKSSDSSDPAVSSSNWQLDQTNKNSLMFSWYAWWWKGVLCTAKKKCGTQHPLVAGGRPGQSAFRFPICTLHMNVLPRLRGCCVPPKRRYTTPPSRISICEGEMVINGTTPPYKSKRDGRDCNCVKIAFGFTGQISWTRGLSMLTMLIDAVESVVFQTLSSMFHRDREADLYSTVTGRGFIRGCWIDRFHQKRKKKMGTGPSPRPATPGRSVLQGVSSCESRFWLSKSQSEIGFRRSRLVFVKSSRDAPSFFRRARWTVHRKKNDARCFDLINKACTLCVNVVSFSVHWLAPKSWTLNSIYAAPRSSNLFVLHSYLVSWRSCPDISSVQTSFSSK